MQDINIILNDGIAGGQINPVSVGEGVAASEPEKPGAADDGHLSDVVKRGVAAEHGQDTAIVFPGAEMEVHGLEESKLGLGGGGVEALSSADDGGIEFGAGGEEIVHDGDHAEGGEG